MEYSTFSLVLKLALVTISGRRHLKSFIALRRHRCLDAADEEIDPLHRLDSESIKALSKIKFVHAAVLLVV